MLTAFFALCVVFLLAVGIGVLLIAPPVLAIRWLRQTHPRTGVRR